MSFHLMGAKQMLQTQATAMWPQATRLGMEHVALTRPDPCHTRPTDDLLLIPVDPLMQVVRQEGS